MNSLDLYKPQASWFAHNPGGIHGIGHAARVFVWAGWIARQLTDDGQTVSIEAVRWAAALHDVGRLSDGIDKGHGGRSADWVAGHRDWLPVALADDVLERILYCCRWHDTRDSDIPLMTPELICIKDGDGLDRVRINDLNPDFLRSEPARLLVAPAWKLFRATAPAEDPWADVLDTAAKDGYLVDISRDCVYNW